MMRKFLIRWWWTRNWEQERWTRGVEEWHKAMSIQELAALDKAINFGRLIRL